MFIAPVRFRFMSGHLIPPGAAERAALRHWLLEDTAHATLAVVHGRYDVRAGLHHLITRALTLAARAKMDADMARAVAVNEFWATLAGHEADAKRLQWKMVDLVRQRLADDPEDFTAAALAAADMAEAGNAPQGMLATAIRIAARAA